MSFQVFLSHGSADKPAVEELARRLAKEGIRAWLDKWNLIPGDPWQPAIEKALAESETCAVFVGPSGFGPWQNEEMRAAIARRVGDSKRRFRVIPVLLPGAQRAERSSLPTFLVATTWVEFHGSLDDEEAFHRLVCGIRGVEPGVAPGHAIYEGQCPYRGLRVFDVDDAPLFFGREALIEWLLNELRRTTETQQVNRFLAILGSSGSGKSSLARAGLISALKRDAIPGSSRWPVAVCRPGPDPVESLAVALSKTLAIGQSASELTGLISELQKSEKLLHLTACRFLPENAVDIRLVVLVDQFEEVFTLCRKDELRNALVANLLYAAKVAQGQTLVILTMRADFYAKCAANAELAAALSDHHFLVGPMSDDEMRRAIERPAQLVGCEFDTGLVDLLVQDVRNQPGALPLLQHALLELWNRRDGRRLTVRAYQDIGKLEGALQRRADETLRALSVEEQELCRRTFLRLTQPGEGTEDTKRRASIQELVSLSAQGAAEEQIIQRLADASLLITEGDPSQKDAFVEVAHEALIRNWPQLRKWIDADRAGLRTRARLTEAARDWRNSSRDTAYLYSGGRLLITEEWAASHAGELSPEEAEFLRISREAQDQRQADELEAAKRLARTEAERAEEAEKRRQEQAKAARVLRRLGWVLSGVALAAIVAGIFGFWQKGEAEKQTRLALSAAQDARRALSRSDVARAEEFLGKGEAPSAIAFLARAVEQDPDSVSAGDRLWFALSQRSWPIAVSPPGQLQPPLSEISAIAFSPDGKRIAVGSSNGEAQVWDTEAGKFLDKVPSGHRKIVLCCVFSPDGARFITGSRDATARIWDARSGQPVTGLLSHEDSVGCVAFSSDSHLAATGSRDRKVRVWDANEGKAVGKPLEHETEVNSICFHPSIATRIVTTFGNVARIWDIQRGQILFDLNHAAAVTTAQFDASGDMVLTTCKDGFARFWSAQTGQVLRTSIPQGGPIDSAFISPSSDHILTISGQEVRVWNRDLTESVSLPHDFQVSCAAFSPDGSRFLSGTDDGKVRVWSTSAGRLLGEPIEERDQILGAAFTPKGRILIGTSTGLLRMWTSPNLSPLGCGMPHGKAVQTISLSPDEKTLLTGAADGQARLWDIPTSRLLGRPLALGAPVAVTAFSADGKYFLTAAANRATLWETATREQVATTSETDGDIYCAAFHPDGSNFATATLNGEARFWTVPDCKSTGNVMRHSARITAIVFEPPDRLFLTASLDGTIKTWDARGGRSVGILSAGFEVTCVSLSPNGDLLAAGSSDGAIVVWDRKTNKPLNSEPMRLDKRVNDCVFSPDGTALATASDDGSAILWDARSGRARFGTLRHAFGSQVEPISRVTFSPDGKRLATASEDGTVLVWDATNGRQLSERLAHHDSVTAMAFSQKGKLLVTGGKDGWVSLWNLSTPSTKEDRVEIANLARRLMPVRLSAAGRLEPSVPLTVPELAKEFLRPAQSTASQLGYWLSQDPGTRSVFPLSTELLPDYIEVLISEGSAASLTDAGMLASGNRTLEQKVEAARKGLNR
jgi:WD40 repeat protein